MIDQHEDEEGNAAIAEFMAAVPQARAPGAKVSGAQIHNFRQGWAHPAAFTRLGGSAVSHYFKRKGFEEAQSACGKLVAVRWLFGPGTFPLCARCVQTVRGAA